MEFLILFLTASVQAGTPLLYATLGETITEKAGNLNLGVEGMMLMGAVTGFMVALATANPALAIIGALAAGAFGALIFTFLTVSLRTNQVVTGLALTIFGTGIAGYFGQKLTGSVVPGQVKAVFIPLKLPVLGDIPFIGHILFDQDILIYGGYLVMIATGIYLYKTRKGLNLRIIGENPAAADASGIRVTLYKYVHILVGGALCGLGGAYLSLVYVPAWQENITAGRGWIAVALVIFATWNPYKAWLGAYFFGALSIAGFYITKFQISVSTYFLDMLPYIATIIVLVVISIRKSKENAPPKALSEPYFREER
ncbi:ABC transporter permease [Dehalobacter sp. DCM]|uniref:ABC transporter permease n=1 Tax=Dehalobacter sp. DCM TaxID=2907827 RepID=UPI0030818047|nr:ABC transporter permease [Dehalobacter sp. DCM]